MQTPWLSPLAVRIPLAGSSILADNSVLPSDRAHCSGWLISLVPYRMPRPCNSLLTTDRMPFNPTGAASAVSQASSQALNDAANTTSAAVATAVAQVCGGDSATAAASAAAQATAMATAKAFASASAQVTVQGMLHSSQSTCFSTASHQATVVMTLFNPA